MNIFVKFHSFWSEIVDNIRQSKYYLHPYLIQASDISKFQVKKYLSFFSKLTLEAVFRKKGAPSSWITWHKQHQGKKFKGNSEMNLKIYVIKNIQV